MSYILAHYTPDAVEHMSLTQHLTLPREQIATC